MTEQRFEQLRKKALSEKVFWQVFATTVSGRAIKRDGQSIRCGHEHRTEKAAETCAARCKKKADFRFCQVSEVVRLVTKKG